MRVLLRADASPTQGTGHVMRCLTLAEALYKRNHEVFLMTNASGISWLDDAIYKSAVQVLRCERDDIDFNFVNSVAPDWVVVDSYKIPSWKISTLTNVVRTLAIIDGDDRGIKATAFLDQNLGAELTHQAEVENLSYLAGIEFVLIRDALLLEKKPLPTTLNESSESSETKLNLVAMMGGSDPTGSILEVCKIVSDIPHHVKVSLVVDEKWESSVKSTLSCESNVNVIAPTSELSNILAHADLAISAAGTSSWEICTLGIPSVLVAVVDNQLKTMEALFSAGLALGLDATGSNKANLSDSLRTQIMSLISNKQLRKQITRHCLDMFDGKGKDRVVDFLESRIQELECNK